ncbi:MazG-like family protein [Streptomyces sp. S186]|uniref:MazG-like family protein n=1 Tax=Streptomyces sp. S186 TaxID=3434395 RepID=UPI003F66E5E6
MDDPWESITRLSAVCGEAMHGLHGLKGLTTCGDEHGWDEVQNGLVGAVIVALLAMRCIDDTGSHSTFNEIFHRRTRSGHEVAAACFRFLGPRHRLAGLRWSEQS